MRFILDFFEYTLDGFFGFLYSAVMIICSLACLGVVGDKVSKKKQEEMIAKREALAQEEYKKAQELIDKQARSYGVDNTLDPTAKKEVEAKEAQANQQVAAPSQEVQQTEVQPVENKEPSVVVLDAPVSEGNAVVDNVTPIVDNTSEEAVKEEVPAVLVINDDGTSNA